MIPVAVVGYGGEEDMRRLAGVSRLRLVYCTINMGVFSVHRSTCKQTGASERSRVRAEIVYITVSAPSQKWIFTCAWITLESGRKLHIVVQPIILKLWVCTLATPRPARDPVLSNVEPKTRTSDQ